MRYLRDLIADGYVGQVLSTSLVAPAGAWGATFLPRESFLLDRDSGNTMLGVAVGHVADSLTMCPGEFTEVSATMANRRSQAGNAGTGERLPMTTGDQIAVSGLLAGGAVASMHIRGGDSRGTGLRWEINGTDGDLVVTGDLGYVHLGRVTIQGGRGSDRALTELAVPARYNLVPELAGREDAPFFNLANATLACSPTWRTAPRASQLSRTQWNDTACLTRSSARRRAASGRP